MPVLQYLNCSDKVVLVFIKPALFLCISNSSLNPHALSPALIAVGQKFNQPFVDLAEAILRGVDSSEISEGGLEQEGLVFGQQLVQGSQALLDNLPLLAWFPDAVLLMIQHSEDMRAYFVVEDSFEDDIGIGKRRPYFEDSLVLEERHTGPGQALKLHLNLHKILQPKPIQIFLDLHPNLLLAQVRQLGLIRRRILQYLQCELLVLCMDVDGLRVHDCLVQEVRAVLAVELEEFLFLGQEVYGEEVSQFDLRVLHGFVLLFSFQFLVEDLIGLVHFLIEEVLFKFRRLVHKFLTQYILSQS